MNDDNLLKLEKDTKLKCPKKCGETFSLFELLDEDQNKKNFRTFIYKSTEKEKENIISENKRMYASQLVEKIAETEEKVSLQKTAQFTSEKKDLELQINDLTNKLNNQRNEIEIELTGKIKETVKKDLNLDELLLSKKELEDLKIIQKTWELKTETTIQNITHEKDTEILKLNHQLETKNNIVVNSRLKGDKLHIEVLKILEMMYSPQDEIRNIVAGERGADILQHVKSDNGDIVCTLLHEVKNTKSWGSDWIQKLTNDLKTNKANVGFIVSWIFPADKRHLKFFQVANNMYVIEADEFTIKTVIDVYRKIWTERAKTQKKLSTNVNKNELLVRKMEEWQKTTFKDNVDKILKLKDDYVKKSNKLKIDIDNSSKIVEDIVAIVTNDIKMDLADIWND